MDEDIWQACRQKSLKDKPAVFLNGLTRWESIGNDGKPVLSSGRNHVRPCHDHALCTALSGAAGSNCSVFPAFLSRQEKGFLLFSLKAEIPSYPPVHPLVWSIFTAA